MQFYSGQHGRLLIDGNTAAKVTNWSFNATMAPLDTTTLEDTDRTFTSGLRSTTGTCRLYYYDATSGDVDTNDASTLIRNLIKARTEGDNAGVAAEPDNVTLELQVVVDANTTRTVEFDVLLTRASMVMGVGEVLAADVSFQVNGAPESVTL